MAIDTLGHLLALRVTSADADDRAEAGRIAEAIPAETGDNVQAAFVDQGDVGGKPADAAPEHGVKLEVVKLPNAERGFVLLPGRWVVWTARLRQLIKDCEKCAQTLANFRLIAFACNLLKNGVKLAAGPSQPPGSPFTLRIMCINFCLTLAVSEFSFVR